MLDTDATVLLRPAAYDRNRVFQIFLVIRPRNAMYHPCSYVGLNNDAVSPHTQKPKPFSLPYKANNLQDRSF
ncbi:hypothetical protein GGD64_007108 [Bradyrhizobium sp. CIR3A]|nr:hypothetical protein [Bradyrhizobium sp. CIR3A]